MSNKNFGKMNIKFKMRRKQCTLVPNLSQFGEFQFLRPNLSKKLQGGVLGQTQPENNLF